jgi:hypothetical protein
MSKRRDAEQAAARAARLARKVDGEPTAYERRVQERGTPPKRVKAFVRPGALREAEGQ